MTLEQVQEKAKKISDEKKRISTAVNAGFCPECGGELEKFIEKTYPTPTERCFMDKLFCGKYWQKHSIVRCKANHSHYSESEFYDSSDSE